MRTRFLVLLGLSACAGIGLHKAAPDDVLVFEGRVDQAPVGIAAGEAARLTREAVRGREPRAGRVAAFRGLALAPLVSDGLPLKRGTDLAVFHGPGGYRAAVPLNAIRQAHPVLADEADGSPLPAGERFLLAWPDAEAPGLETDPRVRGWWVAGVKRVELLASGEADGKALRVPPGAGDDARHGAEAFATWCMGCHRLRGVGGTVGPELTARPAAADPARLSALLPGHLAATLGPGTPDPPTGAARQVAALFRAVALAETGRRGDDEELREPEPVPLQGQPQQPRRP